MKLILVESPTKAKTLKKFLGPNYQILATFGHIRDLPKTQFGIDIKNNFQPKYVIPLKVKNRISELKKEVKKSKLVILAMDPDREGEAIAWHSLYVLNLDEFQSPIKTETQNKKKIKNYQRIVFHEITKPAIEEALKHPRSIDQNLVNAQQARRVLDRIVGYKLSPFLWEKIVRRLSAGRVQSVAVKLVVDREREIENFKLQEYWTLEVLLEKFNTTPSILITPIKAKLFKINNELILAPGIKTKQEMEKIVKELKEAKYKVIKIDQRKIKRNPLPPFITSTLQQTAWQKFHWPAKFTMRIAQNLYERGLITYHRTDSFNLSDQILKEAKNFIEKKYGLNYWAGNLKRYKTKIKGAQEAHEAIRPTNLDSISFKLKKEPNQQKLYDLIWRRFIASQMKEALFDSIKVEIEAVSLQTQTKYLFRTTGQTLKFDGFLKIYPLSYNEIKLPLLSESEFLKLIKLSPNQHFTQPPSRYTEASLIKTLEENGIGRPSTYAPILNTIQERNYIFKDDGKKFRPSEIGFLVNDLLITHFSDIIDLKFTAQMEKELDEIAQGKKEWVSVIKNFYWPLETNLQKKYQEIPKKEINKEEKTQKKCPQCNNNLLIKLGRFGKFYACSNFPQCRYTTSLNNSDSGIICPKCQKGQILEKQTKKRRKTFYGCSSWPQCDFALWDKPTGEICSQCSSLLVKIKNKKTRCSQCKYEINE